MSSSPQSRPARGKSAAKATPAAATDDSFVRVENFAELVEGVNFPPEVWAVFAQLERPASAVELAARMGVPVDDAVSALRRLVRRKLIRKHLLGWREYVEKSAVTPPPAPPAVITPAIPVTTPAVPASAFVSVPAASAPASPVMVDNYTPTDEVETPSSFVAPGISVPAAAAPAPVVPVTRALEPAVVSVRLVNEDASRRRRALGAGVVRFRIEAEGRPVVVASAGQPAKSGASGEGWRLRPLLNAIMSRSEGLAGQFLVYRVFLRVPAELMASSGLKSLSLVDDDFRIRDVRLREAIVRAAREVAEVDLEAVPA